MGSLGGVRVRPKDIHRNKTIHTGCTTLDVQKKSSCCFGYRSLHSRGVFSGSHGSKIARGSLAAKAVLYNKKIALALGRGITTLKPKKNARADGSDNAMRGKMR